MGDRRESFRLVYENHATRVLAFALRRVSTRDQAHEVVAETFLVAWRRFEDMPADAVPWLFGVARGVIANQRRSTRRVRALESKIENEPARAGHLPDHADEVAQRVSILAALRRLSDWDQQALTLVAWEHLDNRRAAAAMGCSTTTFGVRLHRARRRLEKELEERHNTGDIGALPEEAK